MTNQFELYAIKASLEDGTPAYVGAGALCEYVAYAYVSTSKTYMEKVIEKIGMKDAKIATILTEGDKDDMLRHMAQSANIQGNGPTATRMKNSRHTDERCPLTGEQAFDPEDEGDIYKMAPMNELEMFYPKAGIAKLAKPSLCEGEVNLPDHSEYWKNKKLDEEDGYTEACFGR